MKTKMLLAAAVIVSLSALSGCFKSVSDSPFKNGEAFPQCLVGVWVADEFGWMFRFEPDGSIKKYRHILAREVDMDKDAAIEMPGPDEGTYALYVMGDCKTNYQPRTRTLEVTVTLEHYEMVLPNGVLEGNCEDYFVGQVSKDCQTWKVDWYPRGWLEGSDPVDPELMKQNKHPLTFTKVDLSELVVPADPNSVQ